MVPLPALVLTAPTGAGKTAMSLRAARGTRTEVLCADAFTVYRGLDLGTAKPTPEERAEVPHHLLDVAEVTEAFDVARFTALALAATEDVLARGGIPLLVGGTAFYLRALTVGRPLTPPSDPALRAEVEAELAERGLDALLTEIARRNPAEAARLERNPRRVVRAAEVYRQTGRYPGELGYAPPPLKAELVAFSPPLPELETRLSARTRDLLARGWPQEAAWLAGQVPPGQEPRPTVWQALGYAEALALWRGDLSPEAAAQAITLASRQYAKRQLTWLRGLGLAGEEGALPGPVEAEARLGGLLAGWRV